MAKAKIVAEICLYGSHACGHGWRALGVDPQQHFGNGEPVAQDSATDALFKACRALCWAGLADGIKEPLVRVYAPSGLLMADTSLRRPAYFGDLKWVAASVYELNVDALLAASEEPA